MTKSNVNFDTYQRDNFCLKLKNINIKQEKPNKPLCKNAHHHKTVENKTLGNLLFYFGDLFHKLVNIYGFWKKRVYCLIWYTFN